MCIPHTWQQPRGSPCPPRALGCCWVVAALSLPGTPWGQPGPRAVTHCPSQPYCFTLPHGKPRLGCLKCK